jgi:hypothetical protein
MGLGIQQSSELADCWIHQGIKPFLGPTDDLWRCATVIAADGTSGNGRLQTLLA